MTLIGTTRFNSHYRKMDNKKIVKNYLEKKLDPGFLEQYSLEVHI